MKEQGPSLEDLSIVIAFEAALIQRRLGVREDEVYAYVDGRFRLLEKLGSGTFGKVFLAEDCELSRLVALKVMRRGDPEVADPEGKMLAALEHGNVVKIFDHGQEDDYRWLVLEVLRGPTLEQWSEGKSWREILARYLEAGAGLDAAHRRGLVHQDFKPNNVRLHNEGHAVVLDFGLARNAESLDAITASSDGYLTGIGGTRLYMARERLLGQTGGPASDQFAFCVSLWEALSGEQPFGPELDPAVRIVMLSGRPEGGGGIPRRLRAVLERGMAPLPGERWSTMAILLEALEEASSPAIWPWATGSVLVVGLALLLGSGVGPQGVELSRAQLPEIAVAMVEIAEAVGRHDHTTAIDELLSARAISRREGRQAELVVVARALAEYLDEKKQTKDAIEAWMVVDTLSRDLGDTKQSELAAERVLFLAKQM